MPHTAPLTGALILVVDDQPVNIQAVGALLSREGYEVMPALSGAQALERCAARLPDLVLLDMRMPGLSGVEVCQRLKADGATAPVPVIFLTAAHEREHLVEAFAHGAVDYVTKPFVAEELLARVRTHLDLKRTRDHLNRIARERAELTQIVAHDLKSPLSSIQFSASLLQRAVREGRAERLPQLGEQIHRSASDALAFIAGYLQQWADGELQRRFQPSRVHAAEVIAEAVAELEVAASSRGMALQVRIADPIAVRSDPRATRQVLVNLLSNAIKYAPDHSPIDIGAAAGRPGFGLFTVADRGPGISAADQQRLFRRYVRLANAEGRDDSSGLGLAICKQEITQLGGHLWYEDRPGGGAVFAFELPLAETLPAD